MLLAQGRKCTATLINMWVKAPGQSPMKLIRTCSLAIAMTRLLVTLTPSSMRWTIVSDAVILRYHLIVVYACYREVVYASKVYMYSS